MSWTARQLRDAGVPDNEILSVLVDKQGLTPEEAQGALDAAKEADTPD